MIKPAAGYPPLAYSSPKAVQTTGTGAAGGARWRKPVAHTDGGALSGPGARRFLAVRSRRARGGEGRTTGHGDVARTARGAARRQARGGKDRARGGTRAGAAGGRDR